MVNIKEKREYLPEFTCFRALAIFYIVLGHIGFVWTI